MLPDLPLAYVAAIMGVAEPSSIAIESIIRKAMARLPSEQGSLSQEGAEFHPNQNLGGTSR
jgi:hypothetical protein